MRFVVLISQVGMYLQMKWQRGQGYLDAKKIDWHYLHIL